MNAILRFAVKGCLATAIGSAALGQTGTLTAQDVGTSSGRGGPVKQAASLQGPDATPQYQDTQNSEVTKELEKLYRKNGREMPSMKMDDLPNTQGAPPRIVGSRNGPTTISNPTNTATVKPGKPNWFERTFHVGKGRRQQPEQQQPAVAPQISQPAPSAPAYRPAVQQPALRPVAPVYRAPAVAVAPRTPPASAPQAQQGLREPAQLGAPTAVPAVRPKNPASDFQPFADDAQSRSDSESLDLEKQKTPAQPPLILPNQNANGPAESPYSGARISPNEAEQKMSSSLDGPSQSPASSEPTARSQKAREEASPFLDDSDEDKEKDSTPAATPPAAAPATSNSSSTTAPKEKSSGLLDQDDDEDEDDDEDDDEKPLTLPADDAKAPASEPIRSVPAPTLPAVTPRAARETAKATVPVLSKAMRGWCPVVLKDERKLIEARPHIRSEYRGKIYTFSTVEAKELFDDNPFKYAPAGNGIDVVKLAQGDPNAEGTLEHAAWYRGRLYLFSSADTRREFVDAPSTFRIDD